MPTQGNNIGIYVNLVGADYDAYVAGVALGNEDDAAELDYSFDDTVVVNDARDEAEGNWVLVACATTATLNLSNATSETACKGDTAGALTGNSVRNVAAGNQTWNMAVDGLIELFDFKNEEAADVSGLDADQKARTGFVNLMRAALNRTQLLVAFSTGVNGTTEYMGKAFINQIDATAAVGDFASYSCTFEGNGKLNKRDTDLIA